MFNGELVIDADSHWCEPPDLFTRMAPSEYKDRLPRVTDVDGEPTWVFDGHVMGRFSAGGVVARDGHKESAHTALHEWAFEDLHVGAWDPAARLEVMDKFSIDAQIIFPSTIGLGGEKFGGVEPKLATMAVELYNDLMAQIQEESNMRLLGLPTVPAWDVELAVAEAVRVAAQGARGVNMTSDPQDLGGPDLAQRAWDPFWEVCSDLHLPVHFHIGASVTGKSFYGSYPWPSHPANIKLAIGGALLFIGNSRVVTNLILSGVFDRHPKLKAVSVESGCGWIPFMLETLDYEMSENAPEELEQLSKMPSEYFRSNMYATFWFESNHKRLPDLVDTVGPDNIMFETDFPHPTCLYPDPVETVMPKLASLPDETRRKILGENARELYRL